METCIPALYVTENFDPTFTKNMLQFVREWPQRSERHLVCKNEFLADDRLVLDEVVASNMEIYYVDYIDIAIIQFCIRKFKNKDMQKRCNVLLHLQALTTR